MTEITVTSPVVLIIHKRHEKLQQVLEALQQVHLSNLYVIGDGPDGDSERKPVERTRTLIDQFDRVDQVKTAYSDDNMGLETRIPSGLNWVFNQEREAIILEDDCVPDPSFFQYCDRLLEKYRKYTQIMSITGTRYVPDPELEYSYYFSQFMDSWGWATWSNAWEKYEHALTEWSDLKESGWLFERFDEWSDAWSWEERFDDLIGGGLKTWDYRWLFHCWTNAGLHIAPDRNLVTNIGFDDQATHTFDSESTMANMERTAMDVPLQHPPWILRDIRRDRIRQRNKFNRRGWLKRRLHEMQCILTGA